MSIQSELIRLWASSPEAKALCPAHKVFAGKAPDTIPEPASGEEVPVDPPFVCIFTEDGDSPGGTSGRRLLQISVQFSAFATTRAAAVAVRDFARDFFEDADIQTDRATERFEEILFESSGELDEEDGVFHAFQRFIVELSISRPNRRRS